MWCCVPLSLAHVAIDFFKAPLDAPIAIIFSYIFSHTLGTAKNLIIYYLWIIIFNNWGQSWRSGTKCDCKTYWLYFNLYFHFFALVSRQSAALRSTTQHSMSSEPSRKWGRSVVTLSYLGLLCCVLDTSWSSFNL